MIIVQLDSGSTVQKVLRPRNLRKAVLVCNKNKKNTSTGAHAGTACVIQSLAGRDPIIFQNLLECNCTVTVRNDYFSHPRGLPKAQFLL